MNKAYTIRAENLLATLPQALREDKSVYALACATAQVLAERPAEIDSIRIYPRIDELPEELLDILAYDFKVDWWDYRYNVEQKRRTLKDSFLVHKRLGTKYAVKTALSAIYPNSTIQEWFEYDGEPYTFRLLVNVSDQQVNSELYFRAIDLTNYYKNLRSHLRGVEYIIEAKEADVLHMGGQFASVVRLCLPELADEFRFDETLRVGGQVSTIATMPIPELADTFRFEHTLHTGGQMATVQRHPLPELPDTFRFTGTLRAGGSMATANRVPIPSITNDITLSRTGRVGVTGTVSVTVPLPEIPS